MEIKVLGEWRWKVRYYKFIENVANAVNSKEINPDFIVPAHRGGWLALEYLPDKEVGDAPPQLD